MGRDIGQSHRGPHEDDGRQGGDLVEQGHRSFCAEERLARPAERGPDIRTFPVLQQDDADQKQAYHHMDNNKQGRHRK